tara:strand:+ start:313 stop:951 length:639 start_codon:yes stop_codon:yes gene_type:complete
MLSLSIFSSSQTISVALYVNEKLDLYQEKIINTNKIDSLFLILKKVLGKKPKKIEKIIFSSGPGSYTALRSIKAIAQGLSIIYNAKIITVSEFEIYLSNLINNKKNSFVFFSSFKNFFYQYFKYENNKYKFCPDYNCGGIDEVIKCITEKDIKEKPDLVITTNSKNYKFIKGKNINKEIIICNPNAKKMAEAVFKGYGDSSIEILYHHTYYE